MGRIEILELQEKYEKWSANNCNIIYTAPKEVFEFMRQFIEVRDMNKRQRILKLIDEMDSIPCPFCGGESSGCTTCHGKDDIRIFSYEELKQKIEAGK